MPITSLGNSQDTKIMKEPYCGVVAVYAASRVLGVEGKLVDLITEEYISSRQGSSIYDLKKAIEYMGMFALPVEKYTTDILRKSPYPIILHVRGKNQKEYNHYVLYIRRDNDDAVIFDYSGFKRMPFYQLKSIWDGNGIIVSDSVIPKSIFNRFIVMTQLYRIIIILFIAFLLNAIFHQTQKISFINNLHPLKKTIIQMIFIISISTFIAVFSNSINDEGFLAHEDSTIYINKAHARILFPKVNYKKVKQLLGTDTLFIDARLSSDYEMGHLEGAINIPIDFRIYLFSI